MLTKHVMFYHALSLHYEGTVDSTKHVDHKLSEVYITRYAVNFYHYYGVMGSASDSE